MPPFCGRGQEYTIFRDFSEIKRMRMTVYTRRSFLPPGDEAILKLAGRDYQYLFYHTLLFYGAIRAKQRIILVFRQKFHTEKSHCGHTF